MKSRPFAGADLDAVRYPVEEDVGEWAQREVTLAESEVYRRFEPRYSPWVHAIFGWFRDRSIEQIHLIQGSQTAKTLTMLLCLFWAGTFRPGRAFWVGATEEEATDFVTERLKGMIEDSGARPTTKAAWLKRTLAVKGLQLRVVWASSAKKLRGWAVRYVFGDETGIWPQSLPEVGEPIEYVWKRTRMFAGRGRKAIFSTTPRDTESPSWRKAIAAAFYQWWVPCPECGEFQYLSSDRIMFGHCKRADGSWDYARVQKETFYACEKCGAVVGEESKLDMIGKGRLQRVDPDTRKPLDEPHGREVALQIPSTYSIFTTWGDRAVAFLKAKHQGPEALRIYVTDENAEPWRQAGEAVEPEAIRQCIDEERASRTVPAGAVAITAGVDVQQDRMYYVVRAWRAGEASALIRNGVLPRDATDRGLSALDEILLIDYAGGPIDMAFIDSGYDPSFVYEYCLRPDIPKAKWGPRVSPSKGRGLKLDASGAVRGSRGPILPVTETPLERMRYKGKLVSLPAGQKLYLVNTDWAKQWLLQRMGIHRGDPGEWCLHAEVEEEYLQQVTNEERIERRGAYVWRLKKPSIGSHFLDCEVLARAAAWHPIGVQRIRPPKKSAPTSAPVQATGNPDDEAASRAGGSIRRSY